MSGMRTRIATVALLLCLAAASSGCWPTPPSRGRTIGGKIGVEPAPASTPVTDETATSAPATPRVAVPRPIPEAATPTKAGTPMWVVIVDSVDTRAEAERRLARLDGVLGAGENTYVVDESSHYEGMNPGWWVIVEGTNTEEGARSEAAFARRADFQPYVKHVVKLCTDRITIQPK
jgi:hypothetical protein